MTRCILMIDITIQRQGKGWSIVHEFDADCASKPVLRNYVVPKQL